MKFRKATPEDAQKIFDFCHRNNKRTPSEVGTTILAIDGDEIVGVSHCVLKPFIDPMAVSMEKAPIERMRIMEGMLNISRGVFIASGSEHVYFSAEGDDFIKYLENRFDIEKFTNESTFKAKV